MGLCTPVQVIGFVSIGPIGAIFGAGAPVDAWYPLNDSKVRSGYLAVAQLCPDRVVHWGLTALHRPSCGVIMGLCVPLSQQVVFSPEEW
jgi:hypothetical protein